MRSSAVLVAALLCACGPGLNGFSLQAPPAGQVLAKVDVEALRARAGDGPLLVGVAWVRTNRGLEGACATYGEFPEVRALCGDPFAVQIGFDTVMKPLEPDANGVAPVVLDVLPPAEASHGDAIGRVAYGTVVVVEDVDRNGAWGNDWLPGMDEADKLLGASFSSLLRLQQRLVLREGGWNGLSFFYPLLGCDSPPPIGFSRVVATLDLSGERPDGACEVTGVDVPIEVAPLTDEEAKPFSCRSFLNVTSPEFFAHDPSSAGTCLSESLFLQTIPGECGGGTLVPLVGCWDDRRECEDPDWDFSTAPPDWWSCS